MLKKNKFNVFDTLITLLKIDQINSIVLCIKIVLATNVFKKIPCILINNLVRLWINILNGIDISKE